MTEPGRIEQEHGRTIAIFADQVKVGMVIEHPGSIMPEKFGGKVLVTQHRIEEGREFAGMNLGDTVFILGERVEDGSAYHYCAGRSMVWLCHDVSAASSSSASSGSVGEQT